MFFKSKKNEVADVSGAEAARTIPAEYNSKANHATTSPEVQAEAQITASAPHIQDVSKLSEEELRQRAAHSKQLSASFGELVSLFMRTPEFKDVTLGQLENFVVPALATGQFLIAGAQSRTNGMTAPVAAILWATVSEEIDEVLSRNSDQPIKLQANDWKSGGIPWLVCVAGNGKIVDELIQKVQTGVLNDRPIKMRKPDTDGQMAIMMLPAQPST